MSDERAKLEKFKFFVAQQISKEFLLNFAIPPEVEVEIMAQDIVLMVRQSIWGEPLSRVSYPRDWWQALKDRWFPKWAKMLWPIKYSVIEARALYPKWKPDEAVINIIKYPIERSA